MNIPSSYNSNMNLRKTVSLFQIFAFFQMLVSNICSKKANTCTKQLMLLWHSAIFLNHNAHIPSTMTELIKPVMRLV